MTHSSTLTLSEIPDMPSTPPTGDPSPGWTNAPATPASPPSSPGGTPTNGAHAPNRPATSPSSAARRPVQPPPIPLGMLGGAGSSQEPEADANEQDLEEALLRAPPWLVSTVLHMAVLIVLGLMYFTSGSKTQIEVQAVYGEKLGEQLDDSLTLPTDMPDPNVDKAIFSPLDLPTVSDPLAVPTLADISPRANVSGSNTSSAAPVGVALRGRAKGMKKVLLRVFGGTKETQEAVRRALEWLRRNQRADGSWSLKGPYADGAYDEDFPAATGMALLAFQGDGHTHRDGEHQSVVRKGWEALLKMQSPEGQFLAGGLPVQHQLYAHAQCTIALCELYGMTQDSRFRAPAERALAFCFKAQDPKLGGWRYQPAIESDLSVTGWFLMALQSARMAGLEVPPETLEKAGQFLDDVQTAGGSQYAYLPRGHSNPAMTAEGLLSRQYLGWRRDDPRLVGGANYIAANPIKIEESNRDVYYWYYATQVMHHMEGDHWIGWNRVMRQVVPETQIKNGRESGSWDPGTYKYGPEGGRLFVTCLNTYMLEVYYRHLPIYSNLGQ